MSPQIFAVPETTTTSARPYCSALTIPQGVFIVNETFEVTLTENAVFKPHCTGGTSGIFHGGFGDNSTITDVRTPFYSSTTPQIFAIAVATVVSYLLVILIFITPRTFFVGGPGGGAGFLTRRGLSGNSSVVGVGRRPLLQKIAAVTVAISMTIATADTFKVAKRQYEDGFMDSDEMVREVVGGLEIRVVQVISDTFLWLAQVQTLIRLFPRHKEKVTIKWLGFALILLDVIFSTLNNFLIPGTTTRPRNSRDAIPALSYLFELAIGFIYASCVIYYSMSKYRFAFYHAKMRNICLVALLSMTSVLIPVVFFVIDVSSPDIATWGFYIRWVGAAAASVVVWEWVERIEALERDESKDGILGREVYDGDEMLDVTTANGVDWPGRRARRDSDGSNRSGSGNGNRAGLKDRLGSTNRRLRSRMLFYTRQKKSEAVAANPADTEAARSKAEQHESNPAPPAPVATPVSRADTASAASTVYAVRYHNLRTSSPRVPEDTRHGAVLPKEVANESTSEKTAVEKDLDQNVGLAQAAVPAVSRNKPVPRPLWTAVSNPFKRKRASPPAEVAGAQLLEGNSHRRSPATTVKPEKWNLRSRMDAFTVTQRDKLRARRQDGKSDGSLPVTIIPAQPRGTRTWSPDDLAVAPDSARRALGSGANEDNRRYVEPTRNGEQTNVTFAPAASAGRPTWSPEDMRHNQQQPDRDGGSTAAPWEQHEPPDHNLPHAGQQLPRKAQQTTSLPVSPDAAARTSVATDEISPLGFYAPIIAEPAPRLGREPSSDSTTNDRPIQATSPVRSNMPHTSSPQPPQTVVYSPSLERGDPRPFADDRQNVHDSNTDQVNDGTSPSADTR